MKSLIPNFLALSLLAPAGAVFAQCPDITLAPTTLPNGTQGVPYSEVTLTQTGSGSPGTWSAASLPPGLALSPTGLFSGTPTAAGTYAPRVRYTDGNGCVAGLFAPLTVAPPVSNGPVPSIAILRTTTAEPDPVSLAGTMSIADPDAGASTITATLGVDAGTLNVTPGTNAVTVTGNTTAEVGLSGTLADINALLAGSNGAVVQFLADGTPFAAVLLTLSANDGATTGTATSIVSGPTVVTPRVLVMPPESTRQLPVSALDAQGATVDGSPYGYTSSNSGFVAVSGTGQLSSTATKNFAQITVTSSARRPADPWVAVNTITPVSVGANIPTSIASSDGFSAFGSNTFTPSTSYYADVYTIALTAGQSITIKADSGDDLDTYMILADADGFVRAINDDDDTGELGVGSRIDFTAPAAGTYTIEQSTFNGLDTGSYTLIVQSTLPPRPVAPQVPLQTQQRVKR